MKSCFMLIKLNIQTTVSTTEPNHSIEKHYPRDHLRFWCLASHHHHHAVLKSTKRRTDERNAPGNWLINN